MSEFHLPYWVDHMLPNDLICFHGNHVAQIDEFSCHCVLKKKNFNNKVVEL